VKNGAFRGGQEVRLDTRAFLMHLLAIMNVETSRFFIYPRMFSIHDMPRYATHQGVDRGGVESRSLIRAGRMLSAGVRIVGMDRATLLGA
jgi:hypothetical protein